MSVMNGQDLIEAGYEPGPMIGEMLAKVTQFGKMTLLQLDGSNQINFVFADETLRITCLMDLAHLPANYRDKIDGILGGDFFEAKKAVLDYAMGVLWLKLGE